jgi:hypothetical protein
VTAEALLLCDCSFVTVFEDANGKPLDVGRKASPCRRDV